MMSGASPTEIAALWRLNFLSGDDVATVCMLWLEQDLDRGDAEIAAFAGKSGLVQAELAPTFDRILRGLIGRTMDRDEAMLRALRLHLTSALTGDNLIMGVQLIIDRFACLSDQRLVRHPRRAQDRPKEVYAQENLGLEYIYGAFYAFDDIGHLGASERLVAEDKLMVHLRQAVRELHDYLTASIVGRINTKT
jgi:hypothetical protein